MSAVLTPPLSTPPIASPQRTPIPVYKPIIPPTQDLEYHRFSVTDYERMIETGILTSEHPVELLEGMVVTKMPRNPAHDGTIQVVRKRLEKRLPPGWDTRIQSATRLPDDSMPEPDIAVVKGDETTYLKRHPEPNDIGLIVEIANSSLRIDMDEKVRIYAEAGIPQYWVVNLTDRIVVTYSHPVKSSLASNFQTQTTYSFGQEIPIVIDGVEVATIPVSELIV